MPAKKPVTVLDRHFPRQLDALNFFSAMLAKYQLGDVVRGKRCQRQFLIFG